MKRPSFQFYPADWRNNAKLRRCSEGARGAWVDVLCALHDSDEYGICRWPLVELARSAGVSIKLIKELANKDVLKGADKDAKPYIFTPRHAGKNGKPVTLVTNNDGPCWYCSRFVRDEWIRLRRGQQTQFSETNQPTKGGKKNEPKSQPKGGIGERQGDGPTSTSTSSTSSDDDVSKKSSSPLGNFQNQIQPFLTLEQNKQIALADNSMNGFIETYGRAGIYGEKLEKWLNAFHRRVEYEEGPGLKTQKDYRWHFAGWLKFQSPNTSDPDQYSPVTTASPKETKSNVIQSNKKLL